MADYFNQLYQFDGNLNNDQTEDSSRTTVVSGTPSYNASPNGQALVTSSANIKVDTYTPVIFDMADEIGMAIKIATGNTDGVIASADGVLSDGVTVRGRWALLLSAGSLLMRRWDESGTLAQTTITGWSLDTWFLLRFATNSSWENAYAVNSATPTVLDDSASSFEWKGGEGFIDELYLGYSVGAVNNPNSPVANTPATGVELDWLYVSDRFNSQNTSGTTMQADTRGTAARTTFVYGAEVFASSPGISLDLAADFYPSVVVAPELPSGGGGGGPVIKEFWS